jgi:DNA-binding transcriptional LysR family regulator
VDTLTALALFVRVAETRSFSEAARHLRLTPSAVSRSVARLERELDARLLHRSTHAVTLTEAGQAFYERAARVVGDFEDARQALAESQSGPSGTLRVDAPLGFGRMVLGPAVPEFLARYGDVRVELSLRDRFVDPVAESLDVLVRVGEPREASLAMRRVGVGRMVVCGAPAYLKRRGVPRTPGDLAGHECLGFLRGGAARPWVLGQGEGAVEIAPRGRLASDNAELLRDAAVAGMGLVCLLDFMVERDLGAGALRKVLDGDAHERRNVYALQPLHRRPSAKARAFVDFLAERLGASSGR